MSLSTRDIRRRIKSVGNTRKITKAMELVSASKMRRTVERVLASREYSDLAWSTVLSLAKKVETAEHPLLSERPVKRAAILAIGSNRGLCGGFNVQVLNKVRALLQKEGWDKPEVKVELISYGRKVSSGLSSLKMPLAADYPKDDITDEVADILPLSRHLLRGFVEQQYDAVALVYTHYHSSLKQETRVRHLLPLVKPSRVLGIQEIKSEAAPAMKILDVGEFLFEPSLATVLDSLLYRLIEVQLFQAVLESEASEHSARMLSMKNASDAAEDMISDLTLAFNQLRQAGITAEIAEIAAGAEALA